LSTTAPRLIILAGIPGSGKSTYAAVHYPDARVVSSDTIREAMGDVYDQSRNGQVFKSFHALISVGLASGVDVVADATSLDARARERLVQLALVFDATSHLVLFVNVGQAYVRNQERDRVVPDEAMERMLDKLERTVLDLPRESGNYDSITVIADARMEPSQFRA
jgi:protein phosphatase